MLMWSSMWTWVDYNLQWCLCTYRAFFTERLQNTHKVGWMVDFFGLFLLHHGTNPCECPKEFCEENFCTNIIFYYKNSHQTFAPSTIMANFNLKSINVHHFSNFFIHLLFLLLLVLYHFIFFNITKDLLKMDNNLRISQKVLILLSQTSQYLLL